MFSLAVAVPLSCPVDTVCCCSFDPVTCVAVRMMDRLMKETGFLLPQVSERGGVERSRN